MCESATSVGGRSASEVAAAGAVVHESALGGRTRTVLVAVRDGGSAYTAYESALGGKDSGVCITHRLYQVAPVEQGGSLERHRAWGDAQQHRVEEMVKRG